VQAFFVAWAVSAAVLLVVAAILGMVIHRGILGVLVDTRGRYSLTQLQIVLWTMVIVPLISGLFWARLAAGPASTALNFDIPGELLAVIGISVGSTASSITVKSYKDSTSPGSVAASAPGVDPPRLAQVFLEEEGAMADKVVDIGKFQNFWFTLILVVGYVALVISDAQSASSIAKFTLPGFSTTFVALLGISHAGYLAAKVPGRGAAAGLNVTSLRTYQLTGAQPPVGFQPRKAP